jgi:hypothetical protein
MLLAGYLALSTEKVQIKLGLVPNNKVREHVLNVLNLRKTSN